MCFDHSQITAVHCFNVAVQICLPTIISKVNCKNRNFIEAFKVIQRTWQMTNILILGHVNDSITFLYQDLKQENDDSSRLINETCLQLKIEGLLIVH